MCFWADIISTGSENSNSITEFTGIFLKTDPVTSLPLIYVFNKVKFWFSDDVSESEHPMSKILMNKVK